MASTINATAHGMSAGDAFRFANVLPTDAGVSEDITYYVLASNLTANSFEFSEEVGGAAVDLVDDITSADLYSEATYSVVTDGIMDPPEAPAAPGSCVLTSAAVVAPDGTVASRLTITIAQPTSATLRHTVVTVTGGSNQEKVIIPIGETVGTIAFVVPGVSYTGTAVAYDTFGLASDPTVSAAHVAVGDVTAPATPTGLAAGNGILSIIVSWTHQSEDDLSHYDLQVDDDSAFGTPTTYSLKGNVAVINNLAAGTWYARVRAVDLSGNASSYAASVNAVARITDEVTNTGATVVINSSGITILDGSLTLEDEFGFTVLSASGVTGTWQEQEATGFKNGTFAAGATGNLTSGRTASLPYWTVTMTNTSGSATFERQAAAGTFPGGHYVRFDPGGTSDKLELLSDLIPVTGMLEYRVGFVAACTIGGSAHMRMRMNVNWYRADGTTLISTVTIDRSTSSHPTMDTTSVTTLAEHFGPDNALAEALQAPAAAKYVRIEFEVQEITAHSASSDLRLGAVFFKEDAFGLQQNIQRTVAMGDASMGSLTAEGSILAQLQVESSSRVAAPAFEFNNVAATMYQASNFSAAVPNVGDRVYREDLGEEFYYDGTRWLSSKPFYLGTTAQTAFISATTDAICRIPMPQFADDLNIWIEEVEIMFFINGGTALSASHNWVLTAESETSGSTTAVLTTHTINSGSLSVWRRSPVTEDSEVDVSNIFNIRLDAVKTGTPGNITVFMTLRCRRVAT